MSNSYRDHWKSNETARYGLGGKLIDPAAIPKVEYDIGGMHGDAAKLTAVGKRIETVGHGIDKRWQGLAEHYDAPEGGQLVAGTGRVVAKAAKPSADLAAVGSAIDALASTVGPLQQKLERLRAQATAFRAWALSLTTDARIAGHGNPAPKDWRTELYPPWQMFGKDINMSLSNQVGDALDAIMRAEEACVSAIESHTDTAALPMPSQIPPVREPGNGALRLDDALAAAQARRHDWRALALTSGANLPWGGWQTIPKGRIDIFTKLVAGMFDSLVESPAKFWAGLAGLSFVTARDPMHRGQLGIAFRADTAKQTWAGVGRLVQAGLPGSYLDPHLRQQNFQTWKQMGIGLIASDEPDGWIRTGKVVGNIAGLFAPSPAKGVGLTHALERLAEESGKAARRGGWWRAAHLGEVPKVVTDGGWLGADVRVGAKLGPPAVRDLAHAIRAGLGRLEAPQHDLPAVPVRDAGAAVEHAKQWAAQSQRALDDEYLPERAALHDAHLRDLRSADAADRPALERDYAQRLAELDREHRANVDAIVDEAGRRINDGERSGLSVGLPDHDAEALRNLLSRHPAPAERAAAITGYLDNLTPGERANLARSHPELVRGLGNAVPPDMRGHLPPLPTPAEVSDFERIWKKLPEQGREGLLDLVLWRNGPVDTASNLPGDFLWPEAPGHHGTPLWDAQQQPGRHPDAAIAAYLKQQGAWPASDDTALWQALDYLRRHPDVAVAEYLRQHAAVPAT
ncbi:hypothetical protein AB0J74_04075 [Asanoa sp. NPDC049573]|uniref:hypothetical protein n=1 Tax=Asanoa sp. NPDC049573 TaxID=3155396 RepID=UPI003428FDEE